MKMAFVLFDGMTSLDWIGFFEAVSRLRLMEGGDNVSRDFCAMKDEVVDDRGVTYRMSRVRPDLSAYDLVFVPGAGVSAPRDEDGNLGSGKCGS